jgi:hypothetical protein
MPKPYTEIVMPNTDTEYVRQFAQALATAWPCDRHRITLDDVYMGVVMTIVDVVEDDALYSILLGSTDPTDAELELAIAPSRSEMAA